MPNIRVIRKLPQANRNKGNFGKIYRLDGESVWEFLYMPLELSFQKNTNYTSSGAVGYMQHLQFTNVENEVMSINNLPLNTLWEGKRLTEYVEELKKLGEPDTKALSPPVLGFSWNNRRFDPCVLQNFSIVEKAWFTSGDLAACEISLTLTKIPNSQIVQI